MKPSARDIQYWTKQDWCPIGKTKIDGIGWRGRKKKITVYFDAISAAEQGFLDDEDE